MKEHVSVIGAGSWGTTLAHYLGERGHAVHLWVYEPEVCEAIERERENPVFLPGVRLSGRIRPTNDLRASIEGAEVVVSAAPSHVVRRLWEELAPAVAERSAVVSASKGIETSSLRTMTQVIRETAGAGRGLRLCVLSGPTFAREVAAGLPAAAVAASEDRKTARWVQALFSGPSFRVYTGEDVLGVELGGALKNVIALTAGISDGLGLGSSARAALLVRGMAEITRLGAAMGADARTFAGLSGFGDLVLTSTGELSRNRTVGLRLGRGEKLRDILAGMRMVAEGIETAKAARRLGEREGIDLPITEQTCRVLFEEQGPHQALEELMNRELRKEFV
ncbi:MAG: NAD(P)-dependent glycerol-3-phosphate dehydrogenase [Candidatus Tectomicrobia bacterium]|nr:NAD(P)-dependent glycerol-3-phosphate dehydrogenase [Candidatus Tectomicrobia bacterium]